MRASFDDIAEAMYETFKKHQSRYGFREKGEAISFWHTLREHVLEFSQEYSQDRIMLESGGVDYENHLKEKCGLHLGRGINEKPECYNEWEISSIMGKTYRKQVMLLDLSKVKKED